MSGNSQKCLKVLSNVIYVLGCDRQYSDQFWVDLKCIKDIKRNKDFQISYF